MGWLMRIFHAPCIYNSKLELESLSESMVEKEKALGLMRLSTGMYISTVES